MSLAGANAGSLAVLSLHMTGHKLLAALRRMSVDSTLTLLPPDGIITADRQRDIRVSEALTLCVNRADFVGTGTGRKVRSIRLVVRSKAATWQLCHRTTAAACLAFWPDERTRVE